MTHHKPYHPLTHSLTGILPACATVPGYRYVSPNGENLPCGIKGSPSILPKPTANYSLLTTNSPFPFSAPVALSFTPPPFRHTPSHPRPRPTTTVWQNLEQNLQHAPILYSSFIIYHSSLSFTFSAKEKDSETGLSYFGSRYYSSDLSIWLSVDPMAGKYPSLSPYVYCADNPVRLVDPDGEDIEIVTETDANGKLIITINFTAKIENKSSHSYSKEEMEQIRDDISSGIKRYYSRQYDAANVVTNVDIICNKDERTNDLMKEGNRHSIYIVDKCSKENRIAEAEDNGRFMNIKWNIGQGANGNNLQRTAAHEFGHLLGLPDIESTDNLMHSGGTGKNLTWGQIQEAVANYKQLKINVGIPTRDFERIVDEHKQRYKYGR